MSREDDRVADANYVFAVMKGVEVESLKQKIRTRDEMITNLAEAFDADGKRKPRWKMRSR